MKMIVLISGILASLNIIAITVREWQERTINRITYITTMLMTVGFIATFICLLIIWGR